MEDKIKKQLAAQVIGTCAVEISESEYDAIGAAAVRADDAPHELWKHIEGLQKMVNTVNKMKDWHPSKPDDLVSAAGRPPKEWINDTGARYDMVGRNSLIQDDPDTFKNVIKSKRTMRIFTGNGVTTVDQELPIQSGVVESTVYPMLMDKSPAVLATGYRCMELGFGFYWPPGMSPIMVRPDVAITTPCWIGLRLQWRRIRCSLCPQFVM